jgi:hypothetical protein
MIAMSREPVHLSDQEILLVVDGELSGRRAKEARAHLIACWSCRSRQAQLEVTTAEFLKFHRSALDATLPSPAGSRALLKARLAEEAATASASRSSGWLQAFPLRHSAAYLCLAVFITLLGGAFLWRNLPRRGTMSSDISLARLTIPNPSLTPGATRPVTIGDVCSMPHEEVVRDVPNSLRQEVFKEYGIVNPRPEDYEIDYLIAPGLGGTEDIHNLWPEPTSTSGWNAHVKDALEERLHQLVCSGELDLPTAQRAIASDWIGAYKKYFGREQYISYSGKPVLLQKPS